jgi:NodT family efflux transporter outer membrane factor (OMF) lipoprotein
MNDSVSSRVSPGVPSCRSRRLPGRASSCLFSRPAIEGFLVSVFVATALSACSLAPTYEVPQTQDVTTYKEAGEWAQAAPADTQSRGEWWKSFGDPKLDELQSQLRDGSQDLRAAIARFDQARALSIGARSNLFPAVNANASATRGRTSGNAPGSSGVATGNDFLASLDFAWEIDLFGRLRNAAKAAGDRAQASAADLAAVELALRAELATDYFSLRGADANLQLLEDTVAAYDRAYTLTKNRFDGGIAAATDVDQAETVRQDARSQLADVRLQRAQLEHAIAVLLGQPASRFSIEPATSLASNPPPIDPGMPSALLLRRPDVASAERAVAAANAEIGVARAAWFPVFTLGGSGGYESTRSASWFDAPSRFWAAGPAAALPLLDVGGRSALNKQARAAFDEAVANYRKTALVAYQEVEDNLAALRHLADELAADEAAAASAQRSAYHADRRYASGVADYIEVTTTHTAALQAQRSALDARVRRLNAAVGLVRALGGGWDREQLDRPAL